jgi:hypothetical protein
MANRTFKVYGQAYAASGDVSVTMSVNGTQVFNGAVNDSSTVRSGQPTIENHLWTYELDENTTGNLTVNIAVTGGELCVGPTSHNMVRQKLTSDEWLAANPVFNAEVQQYFATTIGQTLLDAESAGLYDKLVAGTATTADLDAVAAADWNGPRDADTFEYLNDLRPTATVNGQAVDHWENLYWPILQDGDTLVYTWTFDPDSHAITE